MRRDYDAALLMLPEDGAYLTIEEVLAVRLYSGPAYQPINEFLRQVALTLTLTLTLHPHPFPYTLHPSPFTLHPTPYTLTLTLTLTLIDQRVSLAGWPALWRAPCATRASSIAHVLSDHGTHLLSPAQACRGRPAAGGEPSTLPRRPRYVAQRFLARGPAGDDHGRRYWLHEYLAQRTDADRLHARPVQRVVGPTPSVADRRRVPLRCRHHPHPQPASG